MLLFGVVGYLFRIVGIPETPLVLGMVLAPMLEGSLRQSMTMSHGDPSIFIDRPIPLVLLSLALLMFFGQPLLGAFSKWRKDVEAKAAADV
jgi:putative tricarboxylic transport membrane protein